MKIIKAIVQLFKLESVVDTLADIGVAIRIRNGQRDEAAL